MPFQSSLCRFTLSAWEVLPFVPFVWERTNLNSYLCWLKSPIYIKQRLKNNNGTQPMNNANFAMTLTHTWLGCPTMWRLRCVFMPIFLAVDFSTWCSSLVWRLILNTSVSGCLSINSPAHNVYLRQSQSLAICPNQAGCWSHVGKESPTESTVLTLLWAAIWLAFLCWLTGAWGLLPRKGVLLSFE